MIEGFAALDVAAGLADDHRKLAFVIVSLGDSLARRPQRLFVADLADRHAQENLRISLRGREPGLFDMELVVERQRPGGVRLADHRIECDVVEREIGGFSRRRRAHFRKRRIDLQNLAQIVRQVRRGLRQRDNTLGAGDDADAVPALVTIGNDLHDTLPHCFSATVS